MKTKDFIEVFREMSPEDQATVRAELLSNGTEKGCCSGPEMEQLGQTMRKMQKSKNPLAMCMAVKGVDLALSRTTSFRLQGD